MASHHPQQWFEMRELCARKLEDAAWIPLQEEKFYRREGTFGHVGFVEECSRVAAIAIPLSQRAAGEALGWDDIISHGPAHGYIAEDGYVPAHQYCDSEGSIRGERLVIERRGTALEPPEWLLHHDLIATLELKREGDAWRAISRGYEDVVRVEMKLEDGSERPASLSIQPLYLRDYLRARGMALLVASFRSRKEIVEDATHIEWPERRSVLEHTRTRWQGTVTDIHEGGMPFGGTFAVVRVARTDGDPADDVPDLGPATDANTVVSTGHGRAAGRKLQLVEGQLWRIEWIEPAKASFIVGDDRPEPTTPFIIAADGSVATAAALKGAMRWLWFKPSIIEALLTQRGASLHWNSNETATITLPSYSGVYFGLNGGGLVTVFAKDVAQLPDWQQRLWVAHNVAPDGGVARELYAAQIKAEWATTVAPETELRANVESLRKWLKVLYGDELVRDHHAVEGLYAQAHRFAALDPRGLLKLAKNLFRLTAERFDETKINDLLNLKGNDRLGSLKGLERLAAAHIGKDAAYQLFTPLHGLADLRQADSHLPRNDLAQAYSRCGIDLQAPHVMQAQQLIVTVASTIGRVTVAFPKPPPA